MYEQIAGPSLRHIMLLPSRPAKMADCSHVHRKSPTVWANSVVEDG